MGRYHGDLQQAHLWPHLQQLQDVLVRCDWDVDRALDQLEKSPPSMKTSSPHRNSHFKTVSAPKGKGVAFDGPEEREVAPKVLSSFHFITALRAQLERRMKLCRRTPSFSPEKA